MICRLLNISLLTALPLFASCTHTAPQAQMTTESVNAGTSVIAGGKPVKLIGEGGHVTVGKPIDGFLQSFSKDAETIKGHVAVIDVVPSIDTKVCEEQTHILGETKDLSPEILRVTISRDLPMAQKRFAQEAKLENIHYISDYKRGEFGAVSGLLMEGSELLARAVLVVDKAGVIRYLQIVPDVSKLPDMQAAFVVANRLAQEK